MFGGPSFPRLLGVETNQVLLGAAPVTSLRAFPAGAVEQTMKTTRKGCGPLQNGSRPNTMIFLEKAFPQRQRSCSGLEAPNTSFEGDFKTRVDY